MENTDKKEIYMIPDMITGEPIKVSKEVYEAYSKMIDSLKEYDEMLTKQRKGKKLKKFKKNHD